MADAGFKERGGCSGGGSLKGGGCGRGMCPLPREARKLLKTLIRCAKMHEKLRVFVTYAAFCVLCNRRKGGVATPPTPPPPSASGLALT